MVARHNGIRTDRYKLMHFYQFGEWEFYDLRKDADELSNEYQNSEYQDVIQQLKVQLANLQQQYGEDSNMSEMPDEWKQQHLQALRK